jgi:hypothetical protein
MIVDPDACRPMLQYAQKSYRSPDYRSAFVEQTALNVGVQRCQLTVTWLDPRYNHFPCGTVPDDVELIHGARGYRAECRWPSDFSHFGHGFRPPEPALPTT